MNFSLFLNFDGNCREALAFYEKVFGTKAERVMTYGETPGGGFGEADKDRIMYADMTIGGVMTMFMDFSSDMKVTRGDYIQPSLSAESKEEVTRLFSALSEGGKVHMELQKTFWSELYGMVEDKFGVGWHISYFDSSQWT